MLNAIIEADYKRQVANFEKEQVSENSIVLLGDSLIDFYKTDKYFENKNIVNRGIAGDTTLGVLKRLDQVIKIKPSIVILNIGSNDIVRLNLDVEQIVKNILQIKYELETNIKDVKVYLLSLSPVLKNHEISNENYIKHRNNDIIDEINEELSIFTNLIDTSSCLKDNNNNLRLDYTVDGIHLSHSGYLRFSKRLAIEVEELKLKERQNE